MDVQRAHTGRTSTLGLLGRELHETHRNRQLVHAAEGYCIMRAREPRSSRRMFAGEISPAISAKGTQLARASPLLEIRDRTVRPPTRRCSPGVPLEEMR